MVEKAKIFVLGDSRTGTMSLHNYFRRHGFSSVHYFVEQCGASEPLHLNMNENGKKVMEFIQNSEYDAFSDYPVRMFWERIYEQYPNAYFILSVRKSTEKWISSMEKFFGLFGRTLIRHEYTEAYELVNQNIRRHFLGMPERHFLEVCIDDDSDLNTTKLSLFLGLPSQINLLAENMDSDFDLGLISHRGSVLSKSEDPIGDTEVIFKESKAILGEYGWLYLINDTNNFLHFQFGKKRWSEEEATKSYQTMKGRIHFFSSNNIVYTKFIVPEKSIVYREFMPRYFLKLPDQEIRPSTILRDMFSQDVFYLDRYLADTKSYGHVYFRGDTHPNWLGGYFIYRYIIEKLQLSINNISDSCLFADLAQSVAQYDGDLFGHLDEGQLYTFRKVWGFMSGANAFESLLRLELPQVRRTSFRVELPDYLTAYSGLREALVYENPDSTLPKAVIFRDSTMDFVHELLAQHFSRSVFVWRDGAVFDEIIQREQPNVVIHVMAERFVSRYPSFQAVVRQ